MADHPTNAENARYVRRLRRALARMRGKRRILFLLVRLEGASYADAATIAGVSETRARREVSRAMLDLRRATRPQDFTLWQRLWPL